jgi:hypothetical protein
MLNTLKIPEFLFIFRKENNQYIPIVNEAVVNHSIYTRDGWYVMNKLNNSIRFLGNETNEIIQKLRKYYLEVTYLKRGGRKKSK